MRIACLGKGGSGKSTVCAALARYRAQRSPLTLVIDADINRHMGMLLGILPTVRDLADRFTELSHYLEGKRGGIKKLGVVPEVGSIPPSEESQFIDIRPDDPFITSFCTRQGTLALATVGTYEEKDFGTTCIHVKQKGLELAVHRMRDTIDEWVLFDVTAGTDPSSTTLALAYDLHLFVCEPTLKSVQVLKDYLDVAHEVSSRVAVIGNKIAADSDKDFLRKHVPEKSLLGFIPESEEVIDASRGDTAALQIFADRHTVLFDAVTVRARAHQADRHETHQKLTKIFTTACSNWLSAYYSMDVAELLVPPAPPENLVRAGSHV